MCHLQCSDFYNMTKRELGWLTRRPDILSTTNHWLPCFNIFRSSARFSAVSDVSYAWKNCKMRECAHTVPNFAALHVFR